jgi:phosphoribosylformylglycinamidine cyclo-ligase
LESQRYARRGASSGKEEVLQAVGHLDKGLFPKAFCRIFPDYLGGDPDRVNILHADGAGTKSALAYLYWKETGDISIWRGIAQDAIVMNLDDLLCTGAVTDFTFSSTIGRNKGLIPAGVISEIIAGTQEFFDRMKDFDIRIHYMGGETADVGDLVRTVIVDGTMACMMHRGDVISNEQIRPGDLIVGLASFGKAAYEQEYNSGIGSNGLTSARHDLLCGEYAQKYPETLDPALGEDLSYAGPYHVTDQSPGAFNTGKLLLSPTRTYAPVVKELFESRKGSIHGMVHCSGGGQTKCMHYLPESVSVVKDNLFEPPLIFKMIKECSKAAWREMYSVFNMGHRLEIYCDPDFSDQVIRIAEKYGVEGRVIGRVLPATHHKLSLVGHFGEITFPEATK